MSGFLRSILANTARPASTMRCSGIALHVFKADMPAVRTSAFDRTVRSYDLSPIMEIAGVTTLSVRWPSEQDVAAIGLAMGQAGELAEGPVSPRFWAIVVEHLLGLDPSTALRIALAHHVTIAVAIGYVFREMRAQMPLGDPRLDEPLPAIIAEMAQ